MTVFERLKKVVAEELGVEENEVTPAAKLREDLGADSLDLVELVLSIEDEFKVSIPDEDSQKMVTVQDVSDYLKAKGIE